LYRHLTVQVKHLKFTDKFSFVDSPLVLCFFVDRLRIRRSKQSTMLFVESCSDWRRSVSCRWEAPEICVPSKRHLRAMSNKRVGSEQLLWNRVQMW